MRKIADQERVGIFESPKATWNRKVLNETGKLVSKAFEDPLKISEKQKNMTQYMFQEKSVCNEDGLERRRKQRQAKQITPY